jgi:hypothetical protein
MPCLAFFGSTAPTPIAGVGILHMGRNSVSLRVVSKSGILALDYEPATFMAF